MPDPALVQAAFGDGVPAVFSSGNTDKNTLIVVVFSQDVLNIADSFTCIDTQGNVYVPLTFRSNGNDIAPMRSQAFYCLSCKPGANTVTGQGFNGVTPSNTSTLIQEFSGGLDTYGESAFANGTGLTQSSGNITTTKSLALLFGYELANSDAGGQLSVTHGAGWTLAQSAAAAGLTQYQVVSAIGSYASTSTATTGKGGAVRWIEEIDSFYGPQPVATETVQIIEMQ